MNADELGRICAVLKAMPPRTWSHGETELYAMALGRCDYLPVRDAVLRLVATQTFRPSPADILKAAATPSDCDAPEAVYGRLSALRAKHGEYAHHEPGDPPSVYRMGPPDNLSALEAQVLHNMGGWLEWCRSDDPAGVERAQVMRIAQAVTERQVNDCAAALAMVGALPVKVIKGE